MRQTESVHIVMATYNGAKFLEEQLDSLLQQTYSDITIEICDDGSGDATCDIVRRYMEKDTRISLHRNEKNLGYVLNFMEGIRRSKAKYIMLCDQDDIWNKDKVEITLQRMQEEESVKPEQPVLVFSDAMNYCSDTGELLGSFHENSHLDVKKVDTAHLFMENKCIGCTIMVNQKILPYLEELPKEIRVHDWWLALICSHFGSIAYVQQKTLLYRQHGGNMIGGTSFWQYCKRRLSAINEQREALRETFRQGGAFLELFGDKMTKEQREIAEHFAGLEHAGFVKRRKDMMTYHFMKSGFTRNVALFLFI